VLAAVIGGPVAPGRTRYADTPGNALAVVVWAALDWRLLSRWPAAIDLTMGRPSGVTKGCNRPRSGEIRPPLAPPGGGPSSAPRLSVRNQKRPVGGVIIYTVLELIVHRGPSLSAGFFATPGWLRAWWR